ncbi:hypothetical protein BDFB_008094 [Asbolus verrucosus]|uniref:Uncharacterized protein n=1 Tax=Asbolus verrucosus TaxID=1661398 RepID=A0A482VM05_ASBVE|nr:hypothetical protein BDFB_008094 [Asbolus verrucosus]
MKLHLTISILALMLVGVHCNCGCLKCSKHLQVVSPPHLPYKVIYRGSPSCALRPLPYELQAPVIPPALPLPGKNYDYKIQTAPVRSCEPLYAYKYELQAPVIVPPVPPLPMTGLVAKPDRIVLQPDCPGYTGCGEELVRPLCRPLWPDNIYHPALRHVQVVDAARTGPIIEKISSNAYGHIGCDCRYDSRSKRRTKRQLPILQNSVNFIMDLLPNFIRFPIEQTLKSFKFHQNRFNKKPYPVKEYRALPKLIQILNEELSPAKILQAKPSARSFLQKLQKLNREEAKRKKRSLILDDNEISLPFLRVTDVENHVTSDEHDEEEGGGVSSEERKNHHEEFLKPLNFGHLLPHNPIFYLLNTPIRLLHHFHKFGQQISPVFKSVPHVLVNSKRYLRDFGKNLKNDVLNFASNFIGDFDELDTHRYRHLKPRRFKRSLNGTKALEPYEPEYSLVFGNQNGGKNRSKRYILKVVDEDEVEEFLREKLGDLVNEEPRDSKKKNKEKENTNKKKLVVEKLSSKLIIDNNGRPFVEINGVKRPLFLNKKTQQTEEKRNKPKEDKESQEEDVKEKINSLIIKARERIDRNGDSMNLHQNDIPVHIIKDRISQILTEIQDLINMDFDKYSTIYNDLCKLQNFKDFLVNNWKKTLIEHKSNDIASKIRILDDLKEIQTLKSKTVEDIACILSNGNTFITKKLIKILVRLQKLQCIVYKVVEDFGEKIKMGTEFEMKKETKYIDYLSGLYFVAGRTKHDLERDLKNERDAALENEMVLLDNLRKLLENNQHKDPHKLYEEAKLLWEIKNIDKLQKDAIAEMNEKISRRQKVRKELKILFDLHRQLENCEEKQKQLFKEPTKSSHQLTKRHQTKHKRGDVARDKIFPHKTIVEDKKPIKLISNGYAMTAYKIADGFD